MSNWARSQDEIFVKKKMSQFLTVLVACGLTEDEAGNQESCSALAGRTELSHVYYSGMTSTVSGGLGRRLLPSAL